jgi:hypothetical protein
MKLFYLIALIIPATLYASCGGALFATTIKLFFWVTVISFVLFLMAIYYRVVDGNTYYILAIPFLLFAMGWIYLLISFR